MKKLMMMATIALASVAIAGGERSDSGRPGMPGRPEMREWPEMPKRPQPLTLVLDQNLTPDRVEAYKAEVVAKIDEIVAAHREMQNEECVSGRRIMLVVGGGHGMRNRRPERGRGMRPAVRQERRHEQADPGADEMPPPPPEGDVE